MTTAAVSLEHLPFANPRSSAGASEYARVVPARGLAISLAAFVVAVLGAVFFRDTVAEYTFLVWLLAMVPAFALCHYRGWWKIRLVLGGSMALLSASYAAVHALGWQVTDWPAFVFVMAAYIGLALGWGWFAEVKTVAHERHAAEQRLQQTHQDLRQSHANLKLAQWKLLEAEKLQAVGQLAAGVAHEVKNPLMTILTGVRYLSMQTPVDNPDVQTLLEDMREAVERADAVITDLLDFSAPRELQLKPSDLNALVQQSGKMVKHEMHKARVSFNTNLAADLPNLPLDGFKFKQVLVNLLTNAAHATPPGGSITAHTYKTRPTLFSENSSNAGIADQLEEEGSLVVLQVDDTGCGIPEDKLSRLFEPFFTTKPTGKGTGLGLSVTRQIVEMHGATIDIQNLAEGGARVTIVFTLPTETNDGQEAHSLG